MQQVCLAILVVLVAGVFALPVDFDEANQWVDLGKFEGNVAVQLSQVGKPGITEKRYGWPNGVIHYEFHPSNTDGEKDTLWDSIILHHISTCLQLEPPISKENYVVVGKWQNDECFKDITMDQPHKFGFFFGCSSNGSKVNELKLAFGLLPQHDDPKPTDYNDIKPGEISQKNKYLSTPALEKVFVELAVLDKCKKTATISAFSDCKLWAIERPCFHALINTGMIHQNDYTDFLKRTPIFKNLPEEKLKKISDAAEKTFYPKGDYIIHQGLTGDKFFVIINGKVKVTMQKPSTHEERYIRTLNETNFFGERALQSGDHLRTANVIADSPEGVICLEINQKTFNLIISTIDEVQVQY